MKVRRHIAYRGPSLYARVPVVRLTIDTQSVDAMAPNETSRAVAERLIDVLPDLADELGATVATPVSSPSSQAPSLADIVARTALVLQHHFGYRVSAAQVMPHAQGGLVDVVYGYGDPVHGSMAGRAAVALVNAALEARSALASDESAARLADILAQRLARMKDRSLTKPTRWIIWEAEERGIPWFRIHHSQSYVQLGQGHKQRRFRGAYTSDTSYIATMLATSKILVGDLFRANAIPVPRQALVADADAAVAAARQLGFPVVAKPNYWDMGIGVRIDLADEESVREAYADARTHGPVLIEQQISGDDHRITLIHGRMVAAGREIAARVTGDGRSSVRELIEIENRDPRRSEKDHAVVKPIHVDDEILRTLEQQGHDLDSVPEAGVAVALRLWWRHAQDHTAEDVTDKVHPANRKMIERAARLIGLDLAGVDFITPDISRPWHEVGGAINEINPMPGMHTHVLAGKPDVVGMVVDTFFPPRDDGRIPTAAIVGTTGSTEVARLVARALDRAGHTVGLASARGVEIGGAVIAEGNFARPAGAHMALSDPTTTAGVLEVSGESIRDAGLGVDRATVCAVMIDDRGGGQPEAQHHTKVPATVVSLLLEMASELTVLSADDPQCVKLLPFSRAKRLCWITRDLKQSLVARHIEEGGVALGLVDVEGKPAIGLWDQGQLTPLAPVAELSSAGEGRRGQTEAMFAAAIAYGLGVAPDVIAGTLKAAD